MIKEIKKTEAKNSKDTQVQELTNTVKRIQAEFENFKKRNESEMVSCIKLASKDIIMKILPTLDNFELALKNKDSKDEFVKGIELIYAQLLSTLEAEGVKKIDSLNKEFDPNYHEALMQDNAENIDEGIITEEFLKGYILNDEVIRHSKVKVNKKEAK